MQRKSVLAIGLDPGFVSVPGFSEGQVRAFLEAQFEALRQRGYDVTSCLVDRGHTAESALTRCLKEARFDCVVIGAGLRQAPELLQLFEKVLNLVHRLAPDAVICFNTKPGDTVQAVERWLCDDPGASRS